MKNSSACYYQTIRLEWSAVEMPPLISTSLQSRAVCTSVMLLLSSIFPAPRTTQSVDLCVTNGVRYKCTMDGQDNVVLLGTVAATYHTAQKKYPAFKL